MAAPRRSPSPSPTVTLDLKPKTELYRSSSEESIRVLHHAVLFPSSPHLGRVTYIRRTLESDSELIRRQLAAIATQPLTFAEELAVKRKQLEMRTEKRKRDKAAKEGQAVPEITILPPSGKLTPTSLSPTKSKSLENGNNALGKVNTKIPRPTPSPVMVRKQQRQRSIQNKSSPSPNLGRKLEKSNSNEKSNNHSTSTTPVPSAKVA